MSKKIIQQLKEYENTITYEDMLNIANEMEIYINEVVIYRKLQYEKQNMIDKLESELRELDSNFQKFRPKKDSLIYKYEKKMDRIDLYQVIDDCNSENVKFLIKKKCDKLSKLEQFSGIVTIGDCEPENIQKTKDFIDEIRSVKYSIMYD